MEGIVWTCLLVATSALISFFFLRLFRPNGDPPDLTSPDLLTPTWSLTFRDLFAQGFVSRVSVGTFFLFSLKYGT